MPERTSLQPLHKKFVGTHVARAGNSHVEIPGHLLLLLAAALWGFGNVAQKTVLTHLDALSAVGLRCLIGGLLMLPFALFEKQSGASSGYFASIIRVSVIFVVAISLQQACYLGATVTNASFLISTATVMTPLAAWMLLGERPTTTVASPPC